MLLLLLVLAANEGGILEARLEATVDDRPDVAVRLAYRIEPSTRDAISFSALEIGGVGIGEVEASASGTSIPVELEPRTGPKREGSILLPRGTDAFERRDVVRGGAQQKDGGLRVRLPCAVLDLKLTETRTGLFSSAVALPEGMRVVDGYPAQSVVGEGGAFQWDLPLVPAFLSFRASTGAVLFTPPRMATLAVLILLLSVGVVGVRRARTLRP
ncbi:MAG TPA: hypothetical protein VJ921_14935 [Vicinamibacteria bacterium]|nr:hypothetical protein [Vicinamibacteria bacterium]